MRNEDELQRRQEQSFSKKKQNAQEARNDAEFLKREEQRESHE